MVLTLRWTFRRKFSLRNVMGVMWAHLFNLFVVRYKLMELFVVTLKMSDRLAYLPTLGISVVVNFLIIRAIVHKESPKDNG